MRIKIVNIILLIIFLISLHTVILNIYFIGGASGYNSAKYVLQSLLAVWTFKSLVVLTVQSMLKGRRPKCIKLHSLLVVSPFLNSYYPKMLSDSKKLINVS